MISQKIENLIYHQIKNGVIKAIDYTYVKNQVYHLLQLEITNEVVSDAENIKYPSEALEPILDDLENRGIIDGSQVSRDLFDAKIMNIFAMLPNQIVSEFRAKEKKSSKEALSWFYKYMQNVNYIRKNRTDKNISYQYKSEFGNIGITINVSKPEKDPKSIALALQSKQVSYPKTVLARENEGFSGNFQKESRDNLRLIPIKLNNEQWYLQFSPYIYYNEHAIVLSEEIRPMVINKKTFSNLLSLVKRFPHYFFGSNADLPIVGGSILTHDHYQAGNYVFPMENAQVIKKWHFKGIDVSMLKWPLSTIRLESNNIDKLVNLGEVILNNWIEYNNKELNINSHTNNIRHNTITPIARKKNGKYQLDLVLRNNYTNEEYPLGLFHPHADVWNIKKENIGLIEVMGLAILPARLIKEITKIKNVLLNDELVDDSIKIHQEFIEKIKKNYRYTEKNIENIIRKEIGKTFTKGLVDCGVFKYNEEGINAFEKFVVECIKYEK